MDNPRKTGQSSEFPGLGERLALKPSGADVFLGYAPRNYGRRIYGGHLLAQALLATQPTLPGQRTVLSLQAYFVSSGDPAQPLQYAASTVREGRSFSVRAVDVTQDGRLLMTLRALFGMQTPYAGVKHRPMPQVPAPESVAPLHLGQQSAQSRFKFPPTVEWWKGPRPFDIRYIDGGRETNDMRCFWVRSEPVTSGQQLAHRAVLAFISDRSLISAISEARGEFRTGTATSNTSLDHTMWFHADVTAGEWLLYVQTSPFSTEGMGIAQGHLYNQHGDMVASVMQHGILSAGPVQRQRSTTG